MQAQAHHDTGTGIRVRMYVCHAGRIGYAAQNAWIFNDTLKNNVLFGLDYDADRFARAVSVCAMEADIDLVRVSTPALRH